MTTPFAKLGFIALLAGASANAQSLDSFYGHADNPVVVTMSNTSSNQLMVYGTNGTLLSALPTGGQGGVGGNAGGVAASGDDVAVVNFKSGTVSVFDRDVGRNNFYLKQIIPATGNPVSVAFNNNHLYILTTTHVESHARTPFGIKYNADGVVGLLLADGSAAQVGALNNQLIISEKNNVIESIPLWSNGAVTGSATLTMNIPANVAAPFGMATRGNDAYVTIAHADEIALVRNNDVLTVTPSVTQHAPCWAALDGPFLFTANSPSMSVSRYAVYGQKIIQDAAVAATFSGAPTDINASGNLAAVIDADGTNSHVSIFNVDEDGNLTLNGKATITGTATNGVAIVR